jgi:hypothetical protein
MYLNVGTDKSRFVFSAWQSYIQLKVAVTLRIFRAASAGVSGKAGETLDSLKAKMGDGTVLLVFLQRGMFRLFQLILFRMLFPRLNSFLLTVRGATSVSSKMTSSTSSSQSTNSTSRTTSSSETTSTSQTTSSSQSTKSTSSTSEYTSTIQTTPNSKTTSDIHQSIYTIHLIKSIYIKPIYTIYSIY